MCTDIFCDWVLRYQLGCLPTGLIHVHRSGKEFWLVMYSTLARILGLRNDTLNII
jgi:hypothetical protein